MSAGSGAGHALLRQVVSHLKAGRWTEAHHPVQEDHSPITAWLHGIVHIQEGDLEDAAYWYDQAGRHFRNRGSVAGEVETFEASLPPADAR